MYGCRAALLGVAGLSAAGVLPPAVIALSQPSVTLPTLQYQEASGCGGLTLYTWNEGRTEVLVVRINQERIALPNGETELAVDAANPDVSVRVEMTAEGRDDFPYCSGSVASGRPPSVWTASAGRLKVIVNRRPRASISPVSVQIDRLTLVGPDGAEFKGRRNVRFAAAIADPIK